MPLVFGYYRAMEAVANARFQTQQPMAARAAGLARALPDLVWVSLTRPDKWRSWARALRHGRG